MKEGIKLDYNKPFRKVNKTKRRKQAQKELDELLKELKRKLMERMIR